LVVGALVVTRVRRWPGFAAALACYALALAPVLGVAQSGVQVSADRYTYLAAIPFSVLAAAALELPAGWRGSRAACLLAALAVVVVLGLMARAQTAVWRDATTVWDQVVRVHPGSRFAWHNRGSTRYAPGDLTGAVADLDRALVIRPDFTQGYAARAGARAALGNVIGASADIETALARLPTTTPQAQTLIHLRAELNARKSGP